MLTGWALPALAGAGWAQELAAPGLASDDGFGNALALDGELALAGAWNARGGRGAAFAFRRAGAEWLFEEELAPAGETWRLGSALDLDGDTALVAAPGAAGPDGAPGAGAVHVFERVGERWSERQVLRAAAPHGGDYFGYSVSVRGAIALVGAYADDGGGSDAGAACVFERAADRWVQRAVLRAADARAGAFFGHSVELAVDVEGRALAAIGAHRDGERAGAVYVFERADGGWRQAAKLTARDAAPRDRLGHSVSLSLGTDGVPRVLAGARFHGGAGAAFVFERREEGWLESAVLRAPAPEPDMQLGWTVELRGDLALVGAPRAGPDRAGAVHVFERGPRGWAHAREVAGSDEGGELGNALALASAGAPRAALLGAWRARGTGAVRVCELGALPVEPLRPRWYEHALAALLALVLPLGAALGQRGARGHEPLSSAERRATWRASALALWIVAALVVGATLLAGRPLAELGLCAPELARGGVTLGLAALLLVLYAADLWWKLGSPARLARTRERWRTELAILPQHRGELPAFAALSFTAGVCEELCFRGFLVPYFASWTGATPAGWALAVLLPALPFALAHLYQGAADAAKTFVVALLFGALFVLSGSLLLPMVLHFGVDLASGALGVRFRADPPESRAGPPR